MDFDRRNSNGCDRVPQGNTRVRVCRRVQDNHVESVSRFLNPTDQLAFKVALSELGGRTQLRRSLTHLRLDLSQGGSAIYSRLALTEQVQIRPVQTQDLHA